MLNALKADPRTIDLRSLAPHFYSLSERVLELFEEEEMVEVLLNVCLSTYLLICLSICLQMDKIYSILTVSRHSQNALQRLPTMRIIPRVRWGRGWIFCADWMRWRGSVCFSLFFFLFFFLFLLLFLVWLIGSFVVFRVAHEGAKEVRVWAGEAKKR